MQDFVIETTNLTKYYGSTRGIENLNLRILKGELFGFLGPNGAGKSTTIRLLLHLLLPSSGKVFLFGKELKKNYSSLFARIGNVPGELKLYEELTGECFLKYMNGFNNRKPVLREKLLDSFQMSREDLSKSIKQYSRGMKQKLGIIQALQEEPDLVIMDEPSEGLDPLNKNVLYDHLLAFKKKGKTIFFSSHNLSEVEKICDRVGLVKNGRLIALESIKDLKSKMVRKMEIEFGESVDASIFRIPSIKIINQQENRFTISILDNLDTLLQAVTRYQIRNIIFPEPSLEDMFMQFYLKPEQNK